MSEKPGRNSPCPCGSGKKYKNCCFGRDAAERRRKEFDKEFEEIMTGTMLDEYMMLMRGLMMFLQKEMQFGPDSSELRKAQKYFEAHFRPDHPDGVPGTYESNWLVFDLRYGKTQETTAERFMKSEFYEGLRDPGPEFIKIMSKSHLAFYKVLSVAEKSAVFEDMYLEDGKIFINLLDGEFVNEMQPGQIWFTRLYGTPAESFMASKPYFFMKEETVNLRKNLDILMEQFDVKFPGSTYNKEEKYRRMMKETVPFWSDYMIRGENPH